MSYLNITKCYQILHYTYLLVIEETIQNNWDLKKRANVLIIEVVRLLFKLSSRNLFNDDLS